VADETLVPWTDYENDPGYKDLPVQEKIGLFKEWRDATVDRSMALGLVTTQEDENYLNDYLEKAYDGILDTQSKTDVLKNAAARSLLNTEQAALVASMASGFLDPKNEASVKLAEINKQLESYPSSSMVRKIGSDKVGVLEGLTKSPIALAELLIENLPAQFATAALADAAGTAVGAAVAGPGGAVVGGTAGMATGAGGQSLMLEYSGSLLEQLSESGVDLDDPAQIRDAFENKELMGKVNEKALKKGVPPGLFDAASAVLAKALGGKFAASLKVSKGFTPTVKLLAKEAVKDTTLQAGLGVAGEAGGQLLSEGKITSANQVALEGILEVPGSAYGFARGFGTEGLKAVADKLSQDPIADMRARELAEKMQADGTISEVENLARSGAPQTAAAVAQARATSANQDLDQLDLDMNKAEAAKVFDSEEPATPAPMDAQNSLEAAKVWGRIRSRQPVRGEDIERFGFVLPKQWLLNPETGDYEFKAEKNETKKPSEIPVQETATTQATAPEAEMPQAQAVAPIKTVKPKPTQKGAEAIPTSLGVKVFQAPDGTWGYQFDYPSWRTTEEGIESVNRSFNQNQGIATKEEALALATEGRKKAMAGTIKEDERVATALEKRGDVQKDDLRKARKYRKAAEEGRKLYEKEYPEVTATKVEAPKVEAPKVEAPKVKEPALPKWEEVQKNKNQIRFLRSTLSKINKALPEGQKIEEKAGWKRGDYLKALETQYGKVAGLEKNIDAVPGMAAEVNPLEAMNSDEKRRAKKKANLRQKLYSVRDSKLNEGQQSWKEMAFSNIRRIAKEVSERYTNIPNVDDYIFDDLLRKTANYLQKKNTFTEEELTSEAISSILASWAEDSAKDARGSADIQALMRNSPILDQTETSDRPARTQMELDEEEQAAGETKQARAESGANEPRASKILRENGYNPAREKLGPDQKLILDWLVHKLSGGPTPSGIETKNLQSYEDLAKFLSELNKKKVSAKAVSKMAKEAQTALAAELNNSGIGVSTDQISMALTPEGEKARARAKEKAEAKEKVKKDKAEAQELADRGRNVTQNQYLAEKLIEFPFSSTPEQRSRLASEVLTPLEEGNLEEASVEQRLENIKKGQPNEPIVKQPEPSKPVSRRRKRTGVREQPSVQQPSGSGDTQSRGTPASVGSTASESETNQNSGSRTRPGRRQPGVGKEQPATAGNVPSLKVDAGFENLDISKAARAALNDLFNTLRAIRFPGELKVGQTDNPVYVLKSDRQGLSIYVSPEALLAQKRQLIRKFGKEEGAKRWVNWQLMAVATHETVHNVHLKQLEKEAGQLGLTFDQHLKNEAKRVARLLNKNRRLKKLVARLYNNDEGKFANDEQQYFEFIRMMVENETVGSVTEDNTITTEELAAFMDDIERKSLSDFIDSIIQAITNIAARLVGVRDNDARYLINTTRLLRQKSLNILRPPMQEKAGNAYVEPKKTESKFEKPPVTPEVENSGLFTARKEFLQEYAKELGIKVPTAKITGVRFNPKTRKSEEFKTYVPTWNKAQYVEAIQAKLKELGQKAKAARSEVIGAAIPTDRPYWMKNDGEVLEVPEEALIDLNAIGTHAETAIEWLNENQPEDPFLLEWRLVDTYSKKEQQEKPVEEMLKRGWLRVVGDGFNLYFEGSPSKTQLDKLLEAAIEDEVKLIQDLTSISGRPRSKVVYAPPQSDVIGAPAMPRRGFLSNQRNGSQKKMNLPDSIDELAFEREVPGGSHPVAIYQDVDGNRFIVKTDQSREQFENEVAAENVYRVLNYPVADSKLIEVDGKPAKIAAYLADGQSLKEFRQTHQNKPELIKKIYDQIADGLLIDAFLFNYDSVGVTKQDNVLIQMAETPNEDGDDTDMIYTTYRVDSGGTFDTKAFEEEPRNEPFYYDSIKVFKQNYPYLNLTTDDLIAQLSDLVLNADAIINAVPQRLQQYMGNRLQYMADQLSAVDIITPVTGVTEKQTEEFFEKLRGQMDAVEVTRNNKGNLINKATGKESMVSGMGSKVVPKSEFRYRLERTPLFKAWFGDWENAPQSRATSKILDESGEPALMYHGTGSYLQRYSDLYKDELTNAIKTPSYLRRLAMNRFKGIWTSTMREWAERWATKNNPEGHFEGQVVIPMYVKSTKPFDPRSPENIDRLLEVVKGQGYTPDPEVEFAFRSGLHDWQIFEGKLDYRKEDGSLTGPRNMPDVDELRKQGVSEETIKKMWGKTYGYPSLKNIIDLGYDGVWLKEGRDAEASLAIDAARRLMADQTDAKLKADYEQALAKYNENSAWNFLAFRRDGVKNAMNSGRFSSIPEPAEMKKSQLAQKLEALITKDGATGRNVLRYKGQTMYSTNSAAALASYAVASDSALNRHNIAKIKFKGQPNTFIFQRRTAPSATSDRAYPVNDILGAAEVRPRRFGVKLEKYVSKDVMGLLKKKNYETLPDSVTLEEAKTYFDKHGLEKSALASLMDDEGEPIQAGAQEALGMLVIKGYREEAKTRPEAAAEMAAFLDQFLEKSTNTARALRAYQFISLLGPEGMEALYYKKARKRDALMRESFKEFIKKAQDKLNPLAQDALEKVLKDLEQVINKATNLSKSNNRKIAAKTTMTLWQQFSDSVAKRMTDSVAERLAELEPQEGEGVVEGEGGAATVAGSPNKPKTINQEATAALRRIKGMIDNLSKEQGKAIKDVEVEGNPENENASNEQIEDLIKLKQKAKTISRMSDLLALWPKALQAWSQIKDSVREEVAANPKLAPIFNDYLKTALDQPFTLPQIKTLLKASDIDLKTLIREHFRKNTMQKQASDLAKLFIEQANLGEVFNKTTEADLLQAQGANTESTSEVGVTPTIAEKLETAIAKRIEELVRTEANKALTNLIKSQADKRLEPSLKRFLDRLVKATSLGLMDKDNINLWSQFAEQEGLTDPKLAEEVYNLAEEAETKPEGYQRNVYYQKAMRAIYEKTEMNKWDFTLTWWYSSILSGYDTQLANLYGNASTAFCVLMPELIHSSLTGNAGAEKRSALLRGIQVGWADFLNIMGTGTSWTKQVQLSISSLKATDTGEVLRERAKGLPQKLGTYSTTVSRFMSAVDSLFYNMNKEYYLYKYAYNKALELGLSPKDASAQALASALRDSNSMKSAQSDAILEGLKPGTKEFKLRTFEILDQQLGQNKTESGESRNVDTQELLNESVLSALTNTFQQEPKGFLGNVIHSLNVLAAKQPETRFVIPFTRIVGNVWNMSLDMGVVPGLIRYYGLPTEKLIGRRLGKWDDVKGAEREMIRGRALAGLLFLTLAAGLQAFGYDKDYEKAWWRINGSGPDDPAAKLALSKTGWKPWSIKVGNAYISYLPTPLAIPLAFLGEITDNHHYKKTGAKALFNTASAVSMRAILVPFDMLFLSGLSDLFKSTDSSQPEQAKARALAFAGRLGSSLLIPNIIRDIDQKIIPKILGAFGVETDMDKRTARNGLINGIFIANTPVLRELYGKPDVDMLGNKIPITSRIATARKPDPLVDTLASKNAFPNPPRRELLLGMIPMEEDQYYQYKVDRGTMLNQILNTPEMVQQLKESSSFVAQEIVKKVTSSATEYAKNMAVKRMVDSNDERIQKLQSLGEWIQNQEE